MFHFVLAHHSLRRITISFSELILSQKMNAQVLVSDAVSVCVLRWRLPAGRETDHVVFSIEVANGVSV